MAHCAGSTPSLRTAAVITSGCGLLRSTSLAPITASMSGRRSSPALPNVASRCSLLDDVASATLSPRRLASSISARAPSNTRSRRDLASFTYSSAAGLAQRLAVALLRLRAQDARHQVVTPLADLGADAVGKDLVAQALEGAYPAVHVRGVRVDEGAVQVEDQCVEGHARAA
jgi:hypothetical protein